MQIYFHSCLCSYLSRVPILVEDTVSYEYDSLVALIKQIFSVQPLIVVESVTLRIQLENSFISSSQELQSMFSS